MNPAPAKRLVVMPVQPSSQSIVSTSPIGLGRYPDLPDCVDDGPPDAPCPRTGCRHHLAHRGHWEHRGLPTRDCAIDVANEGPHTLDEIAVFLGLTSERVRQIEEQAFEQLKHNSTMKGLHDDSPQ